MSNLDFCTQRAVSPGRILQQRDYWVDVRQRVIPLAAMSCDYKANVRAFIIRRANAYGAAWLSSALDIDAQGAQIFQEIDDGWERIRSDAAQWAREQPLCRELLYQSRAQDFDGPIR